MEIGREDVEGKDREKSKLGVLKLRKRAERIEL
jgi:hypothetical protein